MTATNGTPPDIRAAVLDCLQRGIFPVPIPLNSSKPGKRAVLAEWEQLRLKESDLGKHFPPGQPMNVGGLMGAPSGIVDVDLDAKQALATSPFFLPRTTWIFGRQSFPRSHYEYSVDDPPPSARMSFVDPLMKDCGDRVMILEVLSTGSQVVIPPSLHIESQERRIWHERTGDRPTKVDAHDLLLRSRRAASAALLAKYWARKGTKHNGRLYLAGILIRGGWPVEEVANFLLAVATAAGDEDLRDCEGVARSTAEKHAKGEKYSGGPSLAKLLTCGKEFAWEVINTVCKWLGLGSENTGNSENRSPEPWTNPIPLGEVPEVHHSPSRCFRSQCAAL